MCMLHNSEYSMHSVLYTYLLANININTAVVNVQQSKSYANWIAMLANNGYDKRDHFTYQ